MRAALDLALERLGRLGLATALLALAALLTLAASYAVRSGAVARAHAIGAEAAEVEAFSSELKALTARVSAQERRVGLTNVSEGLAAAIERVATPLGLKDRIKSQKSLASSARTEDRSEVLFEALTMNEAVNLLYSLDHAPMLLVVRKAGLKTNFTQPDRLDLLLTISLVKPE